jgi:hypothetical protein
MTLNLTSTISKALLLSVSLFAGCKMTTTRIKNPVFSVDTNILQGELAKLISCENINVAGKEINTNGKINSQLEIDITNGQNIPIDKEQMIALGKSIAKVFKNDLKDQKEYNTYQVLFITKQVNGNVTQKDWKGKIFKLEEL